MKTTTGLAMIMVLGVCTAVVSPTTAHAFGRARTQPSGDSDTQQQNQDPLESFKNYVNDPQQSTTPSDVFLPGTSTAVHNTDPAYQNNEQGEQNEDQQQNDNQ